MINNCISMMQQIQVHTNHCVHPHCQNIPIPLIFMFGIHTTCHEVRCMQMLQFVSPEAGNLGHSTNWCKGLAEAAATNQKPQHSNRS